MRGFLRRVSTVSIGADRGNTSFATTCRPRSSRPSGPHTMRHRSTPNPHQSAKRKAVTIGAHRSDAHLSRELNITRIFHRVHTGNDRRATTRSPRFPSGLPRHPFRKPYPDESRERIISRNFWLTPGHRVEWNLTERTRNFSISFSVRTPLRELFGF